VAQLDCLPSNEIALQWEGSGSLIFTDLQGNEKKKTCDKKNTALDDKSKP